MAKTQTGIITKQGQYAQKQYLENGTDYRIIGFRVLNNFSLDINVEDSLNYTTIPAVDVKYIEKTEGNGLETYMMSIYRWDNNSLEIKCFLPSNNEGDIKINGTVIGGSMVIREYQIIAQYSSGEKFILYIGRFLNEFTYDGSAGVYFKAQIFMSSISKSVDFDNRMDDWGSELYNQQHIQNVFYVDNVDGEDTDNIERGKDINNAFKSIKRAIDEIPIGGSGVIKMKYTVNPYNITETIECNKKMIRFENYDGETDTISIVKDDLLSYGFTGSKYIVICNADIDFTSNNNMMFNVYEDCVFDVRGNHTVKPVCGGSYFIYGEDCYFVVNSGSSIDLSGIGSAFVVYCYGYMKIYGVDDTWISTNTNSDRKIVVKSELDAVGGSLSNYYTKTQSDDRYLNEDSNLSDLPNKETARTNLDVYSKGETDTAITNGDVDKVDGKDVNDSGTGTSYLWTADKIQSGLNLKADKISGGTNGNIVTRNSVGNIQDSGKTFNDSGTTTDDILSASKVIDLFGSLSSINRYIFQTPGVFNWTIPDDLKNTSKLVKIIVIGGGGGGGAGKGGYGSFAGGGGGAGGIAIKYTTGLAGLNSINITVGAGGIGGIGGYGEAGSSGGTSSVGNFCSATGGAGGAGVAGGAGGFASGDGIIGITGMLGGYGYGTFAGVGGGYGGGAGGAGKQDGMPGGTGGAGGGGGGIGTDGTTGAGGDGGKGGNGIVILEWV